MILFLKSFFNDLTVRQTRSYLFYYLILLLSLIIFLTIAGSYINYTYWFLGPFESYLVYYILGLFFVLSLNLLLTFFQSKINALEDNEESDLKDESSFTRQIKLLHPLAKVPLKKHQTDAGYDVFLVSDLTLKPREIKRVPLGLAVEIKEDEFLTIYSRSSAKLNGISVADNACDSGYTGELYAFMINHNENQVNYKTGDRVVQLVFKKVSASYEFKLVEDLKSGLRGTNGFGSTGLNEIN